ncbi:MAG TPA: MerR family transcriptional regulator [Anaerolineae bacterium]|nr:MerR family transcriptional regulator [Anaerolineae bacterium]
MKILRTKKLMQMTGLSSKTISRYVKAGWLPVPQFKSFGRYGASNYWPETTIERLLTIKSLKKTGYKNVDINEILKGVL